MKKQRANILKLSENVATGTFVSLGWKKINVECDCGASNAEKLHNLQSKKIKHC